MRLARFRNAFFTLTGVMCLSCAWLSTVAHAEKRVALVIGNATYQNTPALANSVNDAEDMAAALKRVGFTVDFERNLTKRGMETAIARFARLAQGADAALFFYAGHGMQHRGSNYLMPVDARLEDEFNLNFELTRLDDILFGLERASGVKILVLDACRNNPLLERFTRTTTSTNRDLVATRGLAKIDAARGMVVAYSTQANQVAVDGTGRNSPFTTALVKQIEEPGLEVGTLFRRVAIEVNRVTKGRQLPELSVSLVGEFYLNTRDTDVQAWAKVRETADPTKLKEFVANYPTSALSIDARKRLDTFAREERSRIEREQAEHAEKDRLLRQQQAERERLEKERLARSETERKRLDQELRTKAEQERLEKERLAQAQAARERTSREELARAEEERARQTRDEAERQKASTNTSTSTNPQIAMLPPPNEPTPSQPAPPQTVHIPSILQCSAHSANPKIRPAYKAELSFSFSGGVLKAKRIATTNPGWETYEGSVSRTGGIQIKSRGALDNGISTWTSSYSGQVQAETKLKGRMSISSAKEQFNGFRTCSITFQLPLPELRIKLGLLEADLPAEQKSPDIKSEPAQRREPKESARPEIRRSIQGPVIPRRTDKEPADGVVRTGLTMLVDDGSCPKGQIKEITGGSIQYHLPRTRRCIPRN